MWRATGAAVLALGLLAACGEDELILEGAREPLRPAPLGDIVVNRVEPLTLAPPSLNAAWTHKGGSPTHLIPHPALRQPLTLFWSADIGKGEGTRQRLPADPIVAGGRVYALDARSQLSAFLLDGQPVWTRDLTPPTETPGEGLGGGMGYAGGVLYVSSGYGSLLALDAATGRTIWSQDFESAITGPPTIVGNRVYVSGRNGIGWALDIRQGKILWEVLGATTPSGLLSGPAPVVAGDLIVFPFSSGQMIAASRDNGSLRWRASVAGQRDTRVFSRITDLTGDPVFVRGRIIAGSHGGRTAMFDAETGSPIWTAEEGAMSPVWVADDAVFLISDENRLVRLDFETGEIVWRVDLPFFEEEKESRRKTIFAHFGPVLAGGRLIVLSDDGQIRSFDPVSGALISTEELPSGAARNPVVAGGVLYVMTENGVLHAFR